MSDNGGMGTGTSRLAAAPPSARPALPAGPVVDEHVAGLPAAGLRPFISGYTGYRQAGVAPAVHRGLPSPFLTVIFTLDDPLEITAHPDPGQPGGRYDTLVGGLHTAPALITHDGRQSGIQVALSPLGARALLGVPAGELASLDVEGADVLGPLAAEISERLQDARGLAPAVRDPQRSCCWAAPGPGPPPGPRGRAPRRASAARCATRGRRCCARAAGSGSRSWRPIPAGATVT